MIIIHQLLSGIMIISSLAIILVACYKIEGRKFKIKHLDRYIIITAITSFFLRLISSPHAIKYTFKTLLTYLALVALIACGIFIIMSLARISDKKKWSKKYFIAILISTPIFMFLAISSSNMQAKTVKQIKHANEVKQNKKDNLFKLLNEDDTSSSDDYNADDGYSLDSNNAGQVTYKFKIGKNIRLKLDNNKTAKLVKISNDRYNVNMTLSDKNKSHEYTNLIVSCKNKHDKKINLENNNNTDAYNKKQDAIDKIKKQQEEKKKQANEQKQEQEAKQKQADEEAKSEGQDALVKAEEYATSQDLSKQGIYDQLTSSYGEKFSDKAAQYAMAHLKNVDWNQNALDKAQDYKENEHLSKNEIYDQLTSSAEKFTTSEAQYALNNLY